MKGSSLSNWSPRGCPSDLWVDPDPWIMSFIIAFSSDRVEGIISSNKSITGQIFCWFLGDIWDWLRNNHEDNSKNCFIFDNARLHWSKNSQQFMKEKGIKAISIPPYSPQLNPVEKLIGVIKSQIRRLWINDKPLNLKTVEKIVDKINSETWR